LASKDRKGKAISLIKNTLMEKFSLQGHFSYVWSIVRLPNDRVASAGSDTLIKIWSIAE
jgi:WD40 repeat protein